MNKQKEIKLTIPSYLRKGQEIFNFLEFCRQRGIDGNQNARLADTFYLDDEEFDKLWEEYSKSYPS